MIIRTDAVVLRGMDYGETSRIVTLLTREKGKVAVLARGARLPRSRFGSTLQPMSYVQAVFYYKPTRGLQTLTESAHLQRFPGIGQDMEKITVGLRMMELTAALLQEEQPLPAVLSLVLQTLACLEHAGERVANVWPYFQLRLAGMLGFAPAVERSAVEALPETGGMLALDTGTILPPEQAPGGMRASRAALRAFAVFARAELDDVMRMRLRPEVQRDVDHLIEAYLKYHVEEAYPHRSERVIGQLFDRRRHTGS
ncbi:DNA repair protein RecO [Rhodocaloribacter litoris]|uniref:DNA repair protein RecO n=1 Tax=Rhodocaloribacter litoris TaxID=2558931 RepID=UPI00141E66D1|nr:DNA repair protein RecO [Rhodocaloribacter litoris]QXD15844.1 DNA repair protein RecO [Rhodocaloribacter litoris]GIV57107.1 MAG: DNA repair protein RecO [Rhodothermaceae bacterium]